MTPLPRAQMEAAARRLDSWQRVLLLTHVRPDGDALGALLAMRAILRARGVEPLAVLFDPAPAPFEFLLRDDPPLLWGEQVGPQALTEVDGVMVLDTAAYAQLAPLADWLREKHCPRLVLDHHVSRDLSAQGDVVDTSASAASLILFEWASAMDWPLNDAALRSLFVGIASDTGWFRYANTDARTFAAAAEMLRRGVDAYALHLQVYQQERAAKMRLLGTALAGLELFDEGRVAVMLLTRATLTRCGAAPDDTSDIVSHPLTIGTVDVSALLVETDDGRVRVSLRSKQRADVAIVAESLGGGGHVRAAGARVTGTPAEVKQRVLQALGCAASE